MLWSFISVSDEHTLSVLLQVDMVLDCSFVRYILLISGDHTKPTPHPGLRFEKVYT